MNSNAMRVQNKSPWSLALIVAKRLAGWPDYEFNTFNAFFASRTRRITRPFRASGGVAQ